MEDREMLEFAAKAAGYRVIWYKSGPEVCLSYAPGDASGTRWNPLADDGDALRLAVQLGIGVELHPQWIYSATRGRDYMTRFEEAHLNDPCRATRLAITRAAAEIGKAMP